MINNEVVKQCIQSVGTRIARRREQLRMTQHEVAEQSGISTQFFSCVESGKKNIRSENVVRLSITLGVSTDFLLMGRSNEHDRNEILNLLEKLDGDQLRYAEDILRTFVRSCTPR